MKLRFMALMAVLLALAATLGFGQTIVDSNKVTYVGDIISGAITLGGVRATNWSDVGGGTNYLAATGGVISADLRIDGNLMIGEAGEGVQAYGMNSFARGYNNVASGAFTFASGQGNSATGPRAHALGSINTAHGDSSLAVGQANDIWGNAAIGLGFDNTVSGNYAVAIGTQCGSVNTNSVAMGYRSVAEHPYSFIWSAGYANMATSQMTFTRAARSFNVVAPGGIYLDGPLYLTDTNSADLFNVSTAGVTTAKGDRRPPPHKVGATTNDYVSPVYSIVINNETNYADSEGEFIFPEIASGAICGVDNQEGSNKLVEATLGDYTNITATFSEAVGQLAQIEILSVNSTGFVYQIRTGIGIVTNGWRITWSAGAGE